VNIVISETWACLGLIVAIDGDNKGVGARKIELAAELASAGVPPREDDEAIALFVPTWSIETWLALLSSGAAVAETEPLKDHPAFRHLWEEGKAEAAVANAVPGARILIVDASGTIIGNGSRSRIGLLRALVAGDELTAVQQLPTCRSLVAQRLSVRRG